jgi:DNA-binding LytR/AlgR family response regulator
MQNRPFLILKKDSIREMILEEKIVYGTVERNYISLKLIDDRTLRIRKSLQQFLEEATPNLFIRIHKKYIVCINYIRFVDTEVTMVIGDPLPIGREYRDDFLSHFRVC